MPGAKLEKTPVALVKVVVPLDNEKFEYGKLPPVTVPLIAPLLSPGHVGLVEV